jgi:hypothetical protein
LFLSIFVKDGWSIVPEPFFGEFLAAYAEVLLIESNYTVYILWVIRDDWLPVSRLWPMKEVWADLYWESWSNYSFLFFTYFNYTLTLCISYANFLKLSALSTEVLNKFVPTVFVVVTFFFVY